VNDDSIAHAEAILRADCGERLRSAFPLAPLTSFRIGGPAALYLEPGSDDDLKAAGKAIRETDIPFVVLGKGSNVLVSDDGFHGLVLRLGRTYRWASRDGERLTAGGAMPLPALAGVAFTHGLAGLEFGVAIPASVGGAVRMNAGAHGREMAHVLESIDIFELLPGAPRRIEATEVAPSYRGSELPRDAVVVGARMSLVAGDRATIRERMNEAREWRRRTQPLAEPNCGSVFKNPPSESAARLIEESGGKGMSVGGASVSAKHANFIVAGTGATATDVLELIQAVRERVLAHSGVLLEPEVHLVGDLDLAIR
jgi:UDP-N-acetylmuramate dehydrogenase